MNSLIKYIFLILTIMVNNNLLSQSSIPIKVYEKLENGDVNLVNKNVKLSYKIVGQPDDSLKSIPLQDSIFELKGNIRDWIEVRIVENTTKKIHVRKVSPSYTNKKISFYIGNSKFFEFSNIYPIPYYTPVYNQVFILRELTGKSNHTYPELDSLIFERGFRPIKPESRVFYWGRTNTERAEQINFLSSYSELKITIPFKPLEDAKFSECYGFSDYVDILFRDSMSQNEINGILDNLKLKEYYPLRKAKGARESKGFTDYFDKCIPYRIIFSKKDLLYYSFLEKLSLLYKNENILLIRHYMGGCFEIEVH